VLSLLLDENISYVVAEQLSRSRPEIPISSLHRWEGGRLLGSDDETVLREAMRAECVLVTYDVTSVPLLLRRLADQGTSHAGVILVDRKTIPTRDVGGLVRALAAFWDSEHTAAWIDRVVFLPGRSPSRGR
jgi:hypothetical protein